MRKDRVINVISLILLVFVTIDLFLISLELFGIRTPFVQVFSRDGRISVVGSDLVVFILSVPLAIYLEVLWEREKWAWFGEGRSIRKNVFAVFLVLILLLSFLVFIGGYRACAGACEHVSGCTVSYVPFRVEILYSCKQIIQPPVPPG
jgi:hypothetical protein